MVLRSSTSICFCCCFLTLFLCVCGINVSHDGRAITIDGIRRILISGSIHYPRSTAQMWPDLINKSKEGGLDAIETYVFWNAHEPVRRQYDFSGNLDLISFLKIIRDQGMYAVLRIGPYVCAEWNYGGFPVWLHNLPGIEMRTNNSVFMDEMKIFTTRIVDMVRQERLFASQGGPIIIAQIENEYGNVMASYGDAGKRYVNWCAETAESLHVGVPWIMCQQSDAPQPMINTCNGWYCDSFKPNNRNSPKMWTENWTGWYKNWGGKDPHRTPEDVAFSVARFFQFGGTFQNYYMYHGGTNFDRTAGGPYITTSYDYDAPLDEYGNLNQPKWGHLKQLHDILHLMQETLTHGNISTKDLGNLVTVTKYETENASSCFLGNANSTSDNTISFQGTQYSIPAWSVTILPDCKTEGYNTAKVNAQTSIMVKKPNRSENEPFALEWTWMPEDINHSTTVMGKCDTVASELLDQKVVTNDTSDYLWYMTSVNMEKDDPRLGDGTTLRINTSGGVLHAYVNGEYLGSEWAKNGVFNYGFEPKLKLKSGENLIALLSVTVGLQNYGAKFDMVPSGIRAPLYLVSDDGKGSTLITDLSAGQWCYKVGLNGLNNRTYGLEDLQHARKWQAENLPVNRNMTWYKATFKAPTGSDPVVVDLQGMGKGLAWVNGNSIGRYWPSFIAEDGCSKVPCDYRGPYHSDKCVTNCGQPTQRWYHVPRSFLENGTNALVLFEEFGGNPTQISFSTVSPGAVCVHAYENNTVELTCHGRPISAVNFTSFGNPQGLCGSFTKGTCEGRGDSISILQQACVGKESCVINATEDTFGATNCGDGPKRLAVEAIC